MATARENDAYADGLGFQSRLRLRGSLLVHSGPGPVIVSIGRIPASRTMRDRAVQRVPVVLRVVRIVRG